MQTRTLLIERHVTDYLRSTGAKRIAWAQDVAQTYNQRTALAHRTIQFHTGGDWEKDGRANRQILDRMFDPDDSIRLPVDLEEAIVFSLPGQYSRRMRGALAQRYGLLNAEIPTHSETDNLADGGLFMEETGRALQALAPVVADGRISEDDGLEELLAAAEQLRGVQSVATQLVALIQAEVQRREEDRTTAAVRKKLQPVRAA